MIYFGISRTVPTGERTEFKKIAYTMFSFSGNRILLAETVQKEAARILGKDVSKFEIAKIKENQNLYIGGDGTFSYSEFHFGAGESSILRMVSEIEQAPDQALVLIEEIENGLHPLATYRMVEYLIHVAERKKIQSIFTTHSQEALKPLPPEAIWASMNGHVKQGDISIEALRAFTCRTDDKLAIFVEDDFAKDWVEAIIRLYLHNRLEEISVYAVHGDGNACSIHRSHKSNPAIRDNLKSICILDGNCQLSENIEGGVIKLPGSTPESEIFDFVAGQIDILAMKLAVGFHLSSEKDKIVTNAVNEVARINRDPHLLFSQVGQRAHLVSTKIVSSAFISLWLEGNPEKASRIAKFISNQLN